MSETKKKKEGVIQLNYHPAVVEKFLDGFISNQKENPELEQSFKDLLDDVKTIAKLGFSVLAKNPTK